MDAKNSCIFPHDNINYGKAFETGLSAAHERATQQMNNDFFARTGKLLNQISSLKRFLPSYQKRVLILKNDGLGDLIIFLPFVSRLRNHYNRQGYKVLLMVREPWKELAERSGCADGVISQVPYRNTGQWLFYRLLFWVRHSFDIIVEGVCEAHDITDCCRCEKRINIYLDAKWRSNEKNACSCDVSGLSISGRYEKLLQLCGAENLTSPVAWESLCAPLAPEYLAEPYILICPDSNDPRKCWEVEKFAEIIKRIRRQSSERIILSGLDCSRNRSLAALCRDCGNVVDLSGKTDLFQMFSLVKNCNLLLSSDTGTAHAGAALRKLTFVICGRGEYGTFFPYHSEAEGKYVFSIHSPAECYKCYWRDPECTHLPVYRCISEISVESVWNALTTYGASALTGNCPEH